MRRILALLLVTPLLANCSDVTTTPMAPAGAVRSAEAVPTETDWPAEENWFTPGDVLTIVGDEMALQTADAPTLNAQAADAQTTANAQTEAVMVFGNAGAGSDYPSSHDQSLHARDRIIPGSVVINAGETVRFDVVFGHRVAIYDDGMRPEDIQQTPGPLLLYPVNRLFLQPFPAPSFRLKFVRPGKYLVLCAINSHFFGANMWGWIHVK